MPSNADALWRSRIYQTPSGGAPADDLPDWLKSQFTQTSGQFQREDGSTGENWLQPGHIIRDANGNRVVMLDDNGQLQDTNDLAMNPDYDPGQHSYMDPNLGRVASAEYVNDNPWQETKSRNRSIATAVMLAAAGAGAYGAYGAGSAGVEAGVGLDALETFTAANPGWEAAYQAAATAAPETAYGLDALESVPFDGLPPEVQIPPDLPPLDPSSPIPDLAPPPTIEPTTFPITPQQIARGLNTARSLFGGGGEGQGQGGQGGGIMGGFGAAPRIGDHRKDDDPFGLKASGWGPWSGLVKEDPKQKVAQALLERNPWSYQG